MLRSRWQRARPARLAAAEWPPRAGRAGAAGRRRRRRSAPQRRARVARRCAATASAAPAAGQALGLAGVAMQRTLGLKPYPTQQLAAWLMLQGRMAEMATGEGKTLATALAAAVAGAGRRAGARADRQRLPGAARRARRWRRSTPRSACPAAPSAAGHAARRARARCTGAPWSTSTAKELGFDYLRDHHQLGGARDPRLLRALAMDGAPAAAPGAAGPVPGPGRRGRQPAARRSLRAADPGHARRGARRRGAAARLRARRPACAPACDFQLQPAQRQAPLTPPAATRVARGAGGRARPAVAAAPGASTSCSRRWWPSTCCTATANTW